MFVIECARQEEAAALLDYLKIIGGETDNLSFGAEGVPLSLEAEQDYLWSHCLNHGDFWTNNKMARKVER